MEILFLVLMMVASFLATLLFYKKGGRTGLFVWICLATVLANLQAVKLISFFGFQSSLGNALYGAVFLSTDILNEQYGKKEAQKTVLFGILAMVFSAGFMFLATLIPPSETDVSQEAFGIIFNLNLRMTAASLLAFLFSTLCDVAIFDRMKIRDGEKRLWLRNNLSTLIGQTVDTLIFTAVAYFGMVSFSGLISIFLTMLCMKIVIALCDTPFMYLAKKIAVKED